MFHFANDKFVLTTNLPSVLALMIWIMFAVVALTISDISWVILEEKVMRRESRAWSRIAFDLATIALLVAGGFVYHGYYVKTMNSELTSLIQMASSLY